MDTIRLILFQHPLGERVSRRQMDEMREFAPQFVCFPEYYFANRRLGNHVQTPGNQARQIRYMAAVSSKLHATVIGGSMPELDGERMYNTCFVFHDGEMLGFYRKRNLFFAEVGKITPGDEWKVFSSHGVTFGVLICADVFHDESFIEMRDRGARVIFIPTFSLRRVESPEEKFQRDREIFVRGAGLAGALVVKVCGAPSPYKDFIQARSLIADGKGVIYRVNPDEEDRALLIRKEVRLP